MPDPVAPPLPVLPVSTAGSALLLLLDEGSSVWAVGLYCLLIGLGMGLTAAPTLIAAQSSVGFHVGAYAVPQPLPYHGDQYYCVYAKVPSSNTRIRRTHSTVRHRCPARSPCRNRA